MTGLAWPRGLLTGLVVAAVLVLLRRAGPRASGLAAALPVTSLPALAWLHWEQGPGFAAVAAGAALYTTGITGLFSLAYAHGARRSGPARALAGAALPALALAAATSGLARHLAVSFLCAAALLVACGLLMPSAPAAPQRARNWARDLVVTSLVSAAVTVLISHLSPRVPPLLCGLVAAIPVVGISTTVAVHAQAGGASVIAFLRSYLDGMGAKLALLGALAWALPRAAAATSWLLATLAGVTWLLLSARWRRWMAARAVTARAALRPEGEARAERAPAFD